MKLTYLLFIIIIIILTYSKESFTDIDFCKKHILNSKVKGLYNSHDQFGFKTHMTKRYINNNKFLIDRISECPIPFTVDRAVLFIKAGYFPYIIDCRDRNKFNLKHIENSISLPNITENINSLDHIGYNSMLIVYHDNKQAAFLCASELKKRNMFKFVFYIHGDFKSIQSAYNSIQYTKTENKRWLYKNLY